MLTKPLRFRPLIKQAIWGGRRLSESLGKTIGDSDDYAESWEIVDHGDDQSVIVEGPLAGTTLNELYCAHPVELMGRDWAANPKRPDTFPLLFKFLDCNRVLSVQVHPNDEQGSKLTPPDLGKTEAWVVLHSEPRSVVYAGLKSGVDRETLAAHIEAGTTEQALHAFHPSVGDCIFIPAGTVHALGGGLLIAEIQQSSNTTFRLFDWNRTDASGRSRPLHIESSLDVTDFECGPVDPVTPRRTGNVETLVQCDRFDLHRATGDVTIGEDNRCHLVSVVAGQGRLVHDGESTVIDTGQTCLLPAAMSSSKLQIDQGVALWMSPPH